MVITAYENAAFPCYVTYFTTEMNFSGKSRWLVTACHESKYPSLFLRERNFGKEDEKEQILKEKS